MERYQLKDKVAIITGAGDGIGRSISTMFANEGAKVVVSDINMAKALKVENEINENKDHPGKALAVKTDITSQKEVKDMMEKALGEYGKIDVLVNNAGILFPTEIEEITLDEWDKVLEVNIKGTFLCSKVIIPVMKKNRWGRIINMSSSAGRSVSTIGGSHYTTAKAAILGFTRAIAKELAPHNITVNAICPGLINTRMVRETIPKDKIKYYTESFPIKRLGEPEEVADLAVFLASERSSYILGASIDINGGDLML